MAGTAKAKLIVLAIVGALLMGVTGTIVYFEMSGPGNRTRQVRVDPAAAAPAINNYGRPPATLPADPDWKAKFDGAYALKPGEFAKRVAPPFIPARLQYYRQWSEAQFQAIPRGPDMMILEWDASRFYERGMTFGGATVSYALQSTLGVESWDIVGGDRLIGQRLSGDWVVRRGADPEQLRAAVLAELSKAVGATVTMERQEVERDAIVIRGKLQVHPVTTQPSRSGRRVPVVLLYRGATVPKETFYGGGNLVDRLAGLCRMPVVEETRIPPQSMELLMDRSAFISAARGSPEQTQAIGELLDNLAKQTSLQFNRERRVLPQWTLSKGQSTTAPAATEPVAAAAAAPR